MVEADGRLTGAAAPLLVCRVACLHCAIPVARVREVMRPLAINPLSGMPRFVLGLAVIRGTPVPVIDAGSLLNAVNCHAGYFVTIEAGGRPVAVAVDQVIGLRTIAAEALAPLPPLLQNVADDAVEAIHALDNELLLLLDTARIIPAPLLAELSAPGAAR
jgi:purine-binding chemotaxis protein CheW